jgi:hypothetical protein
MEKYIRLSSAQAGFQARARPWAHYQPKIKTSWEFSTYFTSGKKRSGSSSIVITANNLFGILRTTVNIYMFYNIAKSY